ncbi:MAG: class I adenylate-forming enzyme family protein [Novosphingobium sp.]|nr:class I adenylate-forming enzyme family protein [Novosphingobium sp.]
MGNPISRIEAIRQLAGPGMPLEIVWQEIAGRRQRVFHNAPASLREIYAGAVSDQPFIVFSESRLTFAESWHQASAFAAALVDRFGVAPGDRVAISLRNYPEWMIAFQAITAIGAVAVAANSHWPADELAHAVRDTEPRVLIVDAERLAGWQAAGAPVPVPLVAVRTPADRRGTALAFDDLIAAYHAAPMPERAPASDDLATILYTSGSTGHPKGVPSTHRNIISALLSWELDAQVANLRAGVTPTPTAQAALLAIPLFHVTGLHGVYLSSFRAQRKLVSMHKWDPAEAIALIEREGITHVNAPSAVTGDLLNETQRRGISLPGLQVLGGGGAARAPEQVRAIASHLAGVIPGTGWGMTETNAIGTSIRGQDYVDHADAVGQVSAVLDLRVVDEAGRELPSGEPGELQVRGTSVVRSYWRRPDADAEAFDGEWFRTGDQATIDAAGYVRIVDRLKDLIIRGGENIGCGKIEAALLEHPAVREATVFGVPDERLGEEVAACLFLSAPVDRDELVAFVKGKLAPFELPRRIEFWPEPFPRTASGKLLKREVRAALLAADQASADHVRSISQ